VLGVGVGVGVGAVGPLPPQTTAMPARTAIVMNRRSVIEGGII
jgi:hypothetical protein